ncbi:Lrp/AsnC family transcriptional regulator [Clostridium sp. DJ247]|uniref:siroheme decarboxylase subunit beta n=1 Tax=Clostridium sp. DJ247 TaxID=2726188 RepID=UPI0016236037|nr:Lrp/AsnC family transcriptional regulator [Clostridium sp. DJ247]MBC2581836.1 Lrp/AsnC family transcriptional regulator [Clostridium sp. DJ247]
MLSLLEKNIVKRLSGDIPLCNEPYKKLAEELGITEEELLANINTLHHRGIIKRIGGVLFHREAGFKANAMVVWKVPGERIEHIGNLICSFSEVTHCYERQTYEDWPYNLFTMIHSESREICENVIKKIADVIKITDYKILYSTRELKKSSMKYFVEEK